MPLPAKTASPAKINTYLRVTQKREDGYHKIESLFLPLMHLEDFIEIRPSDTLKITSDSRDIPLDDKNICWKAATEFAHHAGIAPDWEIVISKKIPVAAGLGGGSSNAAAVLRLLNSCVKRIDNSVLHSIAAGIGADVPFFLDARPALVKGIGEIIEFLDFTPEIHLVLVNPRFPISAKWGYTNMIKMESDFTLADALENLRHNKVPFVLNDLQPAAEKKFPILTGIKNTLLKSGALSAGMSGSGPTMFGICASRRIAESCASAMKNHYKNAVEIFLS